MSFIVYKEDALLMRCLPTLLIALLVAGLAGQTAAPAQGLFGAAKFKIAASDDRFSTDGLTSVVGRNNRLSSRSLAGGTYIDSKGLYLDPMVIKSRADGKVQRVGFLIHNETFQDSRYGSGNSFGMIEKISFLLDGGKLITADVANAGTHGDGAITYSKLLGSASTDVRESGTIELSTDDMAALAAARSLTVHVQGSEHEWTCEAGKVSKQFLPNLTTFYQQQIAGTK